MNSKQKDCLLNGMLGMFCLCYTSCCGASGMITCPFHGQHYRARKIVSKKGYGCSCGLCQKNRICPYPLNIKFSKVSLIEGFAQFEYHNMGKNEFDFADIVLMKVGFISLQNVGIIDQCDII